MKCPTHGDDCAVSRFDGWTAEDCAGMLLEGEVALRRRKGWPSVTETGRAVISVSRDSGYDLERPLLNDDYEAHRTHDEERWKRMRPDQPWPGTAYDLQCPEGPKVWKNYVAGQGPVIRNKAERREYMRLTGHREIERGEDTGRVESRDRLRSELRERLLRFVRKG